MTDRYGLTPDPWTEEWRDDAAREQAARDRIDGFTPAKATQGAPRMIGTLSLDFEAPSMSGPDVTYQTFNVLGHVARERQQQDTKWGEQAHPPEWWLAILLEEVGEAAQEVLGLRYGEAAKAHGDLRKELLHVAAVAVSAIEALDYGAAGLGRSTPSSPPEQGTKALPARSNPSPAFSGDGQAGSKNFDREDSDMDAEPTYAGEIDGKPAYPRPFTYCAGRAYARDGVEVPAWLLSNLEEDARCNTL